MQPSACRPILNVPERRGVPTKRNIANPEKLSPRKQDEPSLVQVVIETPRGSRNKYSFDPEQGIFTLKKVLPEGMVFPHDFGFIPSTQADDGDPLDVLVLMDEPAFPGCLVSSRLVGVIRAEQVEEGKAERNDRLIAVAASSHTHSDIRSLDDLNQKMLDEIEAFFVNYNAIDGKKFNVLDRKGPQAAVKCLDRSRRKRAA